MLYRADWLARLMTLLMLVTASLSAWPNLTSGDFAWPEPHIGADSSPNPLSYQENSAPRASGGVGYACFGQAASEAASDAIGAAAGAATGGGAGSLAGANGAVYSTLYNSVGHVTTENDLINKLKQCNVSVPCSQQAIQNFETSIQYDEDANEFVNNVIGFIGTIGASLPDGQMGSGLAGELSLDAEMANINTVEANVIGPSGYVESQTIQASGPVQLTASETLADGTTIPNGSVVTPTANGYSVLEPNGTTLEEVASNLPEEPIVPAPSSPQPNTGGNLVDPALVDQLVANGVKVTPENVVATGTTPSGQIVFLETGSSSAGLQHIIDAHGTDFANIGVPEDEIPSVVMQAVTEGNIVGYQGMGIGRPIYQIQINGQPQNIAVTVGSNGFIVGANPAGKTP